MRVFCVLTALILAAASPAAAQRPPESRPDARPQGSAEALRKLIGEHVDGRARASKESLARAQEIDREIARTDWSRLDVPSIAYEFAVAEEQKVHDRKNDRWDFDRLPPAIVGAVTPDKWASFVEQKLDTITQKSGTISWKNPKAWKNLSSNMVHSRAFEKMASHLCTVFAAALTTVPPPDVKQICESFIKIYEQYDVDTVHKSTQYGYLPAGFYMQWAGWLGDRRAWKISLGIVDAWLAEPKGSQEPNLDQAIRVLVTFNNRLEPEKEPDRMALLKKLREDPRIPEGLKGQIK